MTSQQQSKLKILAAFIAVYFVWGTTYLAIKYAIETIPPFLMMGMRSLIAGAVLYTWGRLRGDENVTRKELPSLILIGSLFFLIGHGVLAWSQQTVPSGVAALLVASEPIIIALFEPLFTREGRVGKRTMLGMLIGLSGIAVLVMPQGFDFKNANLLGSFGILVAASSWASGAIYARVAKLPGSPLITGGLQLLFGGLLLILVSYLLGEWSAFTFSHITIRSWFGLAYLILFGSIITFSAYTWLLTITSATRISTHTFINPVVAVIIGWAFGGEALSMEMLFVQIVADSQGNVKELGERDCSMQRRNQKIIEETPSPLLSPELRRRMAEASESLVRNIGYENCGTIEYLVDDNENFYFMEMNTRIQVEHPITEEVRGCDLIKEQIRIAAGQPLSEHVLNSVPRGHSIECRINAEDPYNNFAPSPGKIKLFYAPGGRGVRVDTHVYSGYSVPPNYDSMIAKLIVTGATREIAIARMIRSLNEFVVRGIKTTIPFQASILKHEAFASGEYNIGWVEQFLATQPSPPDLPDIMREDSGVW